MIVNNSTFYNNTANGAAGAKQGGGIKNWKGALEINNSTFSNNTAAIQGGGLALIVGTVKIRNTIVADNFGGDCYREFATISENINNIIKDDSCESGTILSGFQSGDPQLDSLQDNGGSTKTMALQAGSPVINAGDNMTCLATDQRGKTRPKGTACDIGAYEADIPLSLTSLIATAVFSTQINLSWTDNSNNETGFKIEQNSSLIQTTAANATSYSDSGLSCGISYSYSIRATNAFGDSIATTTSATTQACSVVTSPIVSSPPPVISSPTISYKLTINKTGSGIITTEGINCGNDCLQYFNEDTQVTLTAISTTGWEINWSGDCINDGRVNMDGEKTCSADFKQLVSLNLTDSINGTVTYTTADCSDNNCVLTSGTQTQITATPNKGYAFTNWQGDCGGTENPLTITITADMDCRATFAEVSQPIIDTPIPTDPIPTDSPAPNEPDQSTAEDTPETPTDSPAPNEPDQSTAKDTPETPTDSQSEELAIDGNGDGILDNEQIYVITIPDAVTGDLLTLESHIGCPIKAASAHTEEEQDSLDATYNFPQGIIYYELQCSQVTVTIYFHGIPKLRSRPSYQKYGPTIPGDLSTLRWYTLPNVTFGNAIIHGQPAITASFTLVDGELGDYTGIDGKIVDPGGVAFEDNRIKIPTLIH
jgi:hypothetical protein